MTLQEIRKRQERGMTKQGLVCQNMVLKTHVSRYKETIRTLRTENTFLKRKCNEIRMLSTKALRMEPERYVVKR